MSASGPGGGVKRGFWTTAPPVSSPSSRCAGPRCVSDLAEELCRDTLSRFRDAENGGFHLCGTDHEILVLRPEETYGGAQPCGNSLTAWNLVRLCQLVFEERYGSLAGRQPDFLAADAKRDPAGCAMFLPALPDDRDPPPKVTAVLLEKAEAGRPPLELPAEGAA